MRVAKISIRKCYRNDFSSRMNRIFADNIVRFYMFSICKNETNKCMGVDFICLKFKKFVN